MAKEIHIIFNERAGGGKTGKMLPALRISLHRRKELQSHVYNTQDQEEATRVTRKLIGEGAETIVAAGGDGTVNGVINGFADENGMFCSSCEFGILRCGTGMGTAQSLEIPENLEDQLDLIVSRECTKVDVGRISYLGFDDKPQEKFFICESQIGIGSQIANQVHNGYAFLGGKLAFGAVTVSQIFKFREQHLKVDIDDMLHFEDDLLGVAVTNCQLTAGGMDLTPGATPTDGVFHILLIHRMGTIDRLKNFPKIYSGKHVLSPFFTVVSGRRIVVGSDQGSTLSADGEFLGKTPCAYTVIPSAIRVKSYYNSSSRK